MTNAILLSFDIEEFDIPEEYGQTVPEAVKFDVSFQGLQAVLAILDVLDVVATFFVTAHFADHHPDLIRQISQRHEIASHGYYHDRFELADLVRSKQRLESITQKPVQGFRMARLQPIDDGAIADAGYAYNSSMHPTYLPGRYNHLNQPRTAHYDDLWSAEGHRHQLFQLPISVTPWVRFPLFWLSFKNFPWLWMQWLNRWTLNHDRYLNIYFHPWEFTDITAYNLPSYVKRRSGKAMQRKLYQYITWLKLHGQFMTIGQFQQQSIAHRGKAESQRDRIG
jgi:peptidoglycan/xylan/chitin deacetylase (PgdA/CDA1 family)